MEIQDGKTSGRDFTNNSSVLNYKRNTTLNYNIMKKKFSVFIAGIKNLKSLLLILFSLCAITLSAQVNFEVSGVVTDDNGDPVVGVNVILSGTQSGTITDLKGAYRIKVPNENAVLSFSYLGMNKQEHKVGSRRRLDVTMTEEQRLLDDVVVIGYGTVAKSDLTGSVSSVGKDAMSNRIVTSLEDALKGQAAGMSITQDDGAPGSDFTIRIRGASSVNASSTPIYVIDGIICEDAKDISPGDVESIEILKDASGTAIYGSRGANGVIQITTKRGVEGKTKIEVYSNVGVQSATRLYDLMNSSEWARMRYQTSWIYRPYATGLNAEHANPDLYKVYRDSPEPNANYWVLSNTSSYKNWQSYADSTNTDWQRLMLQDALVQEYRVNLSGGSKTGKYAIMGNYVNQEGIIINSGYERFSGRMNYEHMLSPKARLMTNISYSRAFYNGVATGTSDGVTNSMLRQPPTKPFTDADAGSADDDATSDFTTNPYYQAKYITKDRFRNGLVSKISLDYNFNKNWMLRVTGSMVNNTNRNSTYYPKDVSQGIKQNGRAIEERTETNRLTNENLLYYKNKFKNAHRIDAMIGAIFESYNDNWLLAESQNFVVETLGSNDLGQGTVAVIPRSSSDKNPYTMASFLGRVNYNYTDRYLLTFTMRADGSSRFGPQHKWGYFPSIATAWRISEESLIKQLNVFDNLKLRLNWGLSGNTAIPAFQTLSTLSTAFAPMDGTNPSYGVMLDRPQNDDLKWETTSQFGAGIDMGFLNNRLSLTVDAYQKTTRDLLLQMNAPLYSGYTRAWANIGSIQNEGIEATLDYQIVRTRKWGVGFNFNIGFNRSLVIDVPGEELLFDPKVVPGSGSIVTIRNGGSLGQWYGYQVEGVFKSQEEIDALPDDYESLSVKKANLRPGDHKFFDYTGDNKITTDDKMVLGSGEPLFSGGFGLNGDYKGFSISTIFQFSYGSKIFNANLATLEAGRDSYNQTRRLMDAWTPTLYSGDGTVVDEGNPDGTFRMNGGGPENYLLSTFLEDGSFLRFSDLTLAYSIPKKWLSQVKIEGVRVFATAKNLFVLTRYYGYDPEVNTRQGGIGDFMPSLDFGSYPRNRAISFGVNLTL